MAAILSWKTCQQYLNQGFRVRVIVRARKLVKVFIPRHLTCLRAKFEKRSFCSFSCPSVLFSSKDVY